MMHGFIAKIQAAPGQRAALVEIMEQIGRSLPGCLSYIIGLDHADPDILWVSEVWDSQESHLASLELPHVQKAIALAAPLALEMTKIASTTPCFSWPSLEG